MLGQREVTRLVHRPRLLHVVVDGGLGAGAAAAEAAHHHTGLAGGLELALAAGDAAVDQPALGEEGSAQERGVTMLAREALVSRVPMLALVAHLTWK